MLNSNDSPYPVVSKNCSGSYGEGALRKGGKTVRYYSSVSASYGLQVGVQRYGYALFFMKNSALRYIDKSSGWEVGIGPSVVFVDKGVARNLTSTTLRDDVHAFVFNQEGFMVGIGIKGSKITRIRK